MSSRQKRDLSDSDLDYNAAELLRTPKRQRNILDRRTTYGLGQAHPAEYHPANDDPWRSATSPTDTGSPIPGLIGREQPPATPVGPDNMWRTLPEYNAGWQALPQVDATQEYMASPESTHFTDQTPTTLPQTAPSTADSDGDVEHVLLASENVQDPMQSPGPQASLQAYLGPPSDASFMNAADQNVPNMLGLSTELESSPPHPLTASQSVTARDISTGGHVMDSYTAVIRHEFPETRTLPPQASPSLNSGEMAVITTCATVDRPEFRPTPEANPSQVPQTPVSGQSSIHTTRASPPRSDRVNRRISSSDQPTLARSSSQQRTTASEAYAQSTRSSGSGAVAVVHDHAHRVVEQTHSFETSSRLRAPGNMDQEIPVTEQHIRSVNATIPDTSPSLRAPSSRRTSGMSIDDSRSQKVREGTENSSRRTLPSSSPRISRRRDGNASSGLSHTNHSSRQSPAVLPHDSLPVGEEKRRVDGSKRPHQRGAGQHVRPFLPDRTSISSPRSSHSRGTRENSRHDGSQRTGHDSMSVDGDISLPAGSAGRPSERGDPGLNRGHKTSQLGGIPPYTSPTPSSAGHGPAQGSPVWRREAGGPRSSKAARHPPGRPRGMMSAGSDAMSTGSRTTRTDKNGDILGKTGAENAGSRKNDSHQGNISPSPGTSARQEAGDAMSIDSPNTRQTGSHIRRDSEHGSLSRGEDDFSDVDRHGGTEDNDQSDSESDQNRAGARNIRLMRSAGRKRRDRPYPPIYTDFTHPHDRDRKSLQTKNLHNAIRDMMHELLGFGPKRVALPLPHPPAAIDDVASFLNGGVGPSLRFLQLDLVTTSDGVASHWNTSAARMFATDFLGRVADHCFPEDAFSQQELEPRVIEEIFLSKIRYCMKLYQDVYFPLSPREIIEGRAYNRRTTRRNKLKSLRDRVCNSPDVVLSGTVLQELHSIMQYVDDEMVSEDETDDEYSLPGLKVFRRVERVWVNPEVTLILHMLIDVRIQQLNEYGELGPGMKFRQRINHPPRRVVDSDVVVGLPFNFYNPAWYRSLTNEEQAELRCTDSIDLGPFLALLRGKQCCENSLQRI